MQNIRRLPKPDSLVKHSEKWTNELLDQIKLSLETGDPVNDSYYNKYNKDDIRDTLNKMYHNRCCYCESKIGIVDFPHIEHRKPKRQNHGVPSTPFPECTYDWDNLHLACQKCNNSKGTKYNYEDPILDSVIDVPIEEHFTYQMGVDGILWCPLTERGKTTVKDADLNRTELGKARLDIFSEVFNQLSFIKRNPGNPGNEIAISELEKKANIESSYGSVIVFLLRNQSIIK